jgi:hypothetical protein
MALKGLLQKNRIDNTILRQKSPKNLQHGAKKRNIWPFFRYFIGKTPNKLNFY